MGRSSRYPDELRERASPTDGRRDQDYRSQRAAICEVAGKLGVRTPETVRTWVRRAEVDSGGRPGVSTEQAGEVAGLKRENAELRRADEILKAAAIFLRGRARPARETVIAFITEHKDLRVNTGSGAGLRWGVEPMRAVLTEHGIKISPSTYYEWVGKEPSRQQLRDVEVTEVIAADRGSSAWTPSSTRSSPAPKKASPTCPG